MNDIVKHEQVSAPAMPQSGQVMEATEQSRAVAEIQAAMTIAKKFPRDYQKARERILQACLRPSLADKAQYTYARGGTSIEGASIRLAEAIAQAWGNLQFGIRELEQRNGESTVEAFAWDLETNTRQVKVFTVRHWRDTKQGGYAIKDARDIYEMVANQGARRLRACILGVVPGDVVEEAVEQCEETLRQAGKNVTPEKITSMVEKFAEFNVTKEMIEKRVQRNIAAIDAPLLISLGKIYNSLKDGMAKPADFFEFIAPQIQQQPAQAAQTAGELAVNWDATLDDCVKQISDLKNEDELDAALKEISNTKLADIQKAPKGTATRWAQAVKQKRDALREATKANHNNPRKD